MSVYDDTANVKVLQLSQNQGNQVSISVDCYYKTQSQVAFKKNGQSTTVGCGENEVIGTVATLKGKTVLFSGTAANPSGGQIKVVYTITEQGGNSTTYTFPDDVSGFDTTDQAPTYLFNIQFN